MPCRHFLLILGGVLAVLCTVWAVCAGADQLEPLPPLEPVVPLVDFTDEPGFFRRWQQDHARRAAVDETGIITDRPSFTYSDTTVPKGWAQVESGYLYANRSSYPSRSLHVLPELALRLGMTRRVEFRAIWNGPALLGGGRYSEYDYSNNWVANLQVGFKFQISTHGGWMPQSALVTTLFVPTGDGWALPIPSNMLNRSQHVAPLVDYIYTWSLTDKLSLGGSTGGVFDSEDYFSLTEYFQSVILRYQCTPRLSLFAEGYAVFGHQKVYRYFYFPGLYYGYGYFAYRDESYVAPYLDGGLKWRPSHNVQFDWRAGLGLNQNADNFFTGVGFSFRY